MLRQAARILEHPVGINSDEWLLVASNVGEAYNFLRSLPSGQGQSEQDLLDRVIVEFRRETDDFRDPFFLRSTGPARRRAPDLFQPSR